MITAVVATNDTTDLIRTCDSALKDAILAIQQPRTDFQLKHFVIGQHDAEPRRWLQCVLELQIKLQNLKRAGIEQRMTGRRIDALRAEGTPDALDRAELLEIDLEAQGLAIVGAIRETQALFAIFRSFPRGYTNEELNAAEADYWQKRLARQARHSLAATGRIGVGDLDALHQTGRPVTVETIRELEAELCRTMNITTIGRNIDGSESV